MICKRASFYRKIKANSNKMNHSAKISILLVISCLAACTNHAPAPVDDIRYTQKHKNQSPFNISPSNLDILSKTNQHKVLPGETLFAIAWRYSLDYHSIAKLNGLKAFRIYPGQKLVLRKTETRSIFNAPSLLAAINTDFLNKKEKWIKKNSEQKTTQLVTNKKHQANNRIPSNLKKPMQYRKATPSRNTNNKIKNWIWPVNGKVVKGFSAKQNQNKGLDIKAKKGTAVRATAPGKVVYSGAGLKGYGQLVIIKHNDSYLSAYAHNNKIHVLENEVVKAGQRIADLGKSGADTFKLHFEIRYKGKPVNPLNYLPKT